MSAANVTSGAMSSQLGGKATQGAIVAAVMAGIIASNGGW
jgi:hypothetical protein